MKIQLSVLALAAILVASMSTAPIYGQQLQMNDTVMVAPIAVSTDMPTYKTGDTILVNGMIARGGEGAVSIQIVGPDDIQNRVGVAQIMPNIDNTFEAEFTAGGPLMNRDGTYTVKAQYGLIRTIEAVATFEFHAEEVADPGNEPTEKKVDDNIGESTISIEGSEDMISYEINGGRILSVVPDVESNSLVITIETTDDGALEMTIPRTILDSKTGDKDEDLYVLIDYEEASFEESRTDADITVTIPFMHGAEEIEIFGTWVVPEFGIIAVMVLAVAIISVIAISSRSRLSVIPKI